MVPNGAVACIACTPGNISRREMQDRSELRLENIGRHIKFYRSPMVRLSHFNLWLLFWMERKFFQKYSNSILSLLKCMKLMLISALLLIIINYYLLLLMYIIIKLLLIMINVHY